MSPRILGALAVADFRERARRPAFLVTLLAAVALAYAAAPPTSATYSLLNVGGYRGTYDAEYIGMVLALMGGLWLSFAGFYVVKNAISRDEATGVGQILAATPLSKVAYTLGKFASNLLVLTALAAILALMAPVMQLLRGESGEVGLAGLFLPFLLFPLPMLAVSAAAAVVFETLRPLRDGFGNVVWFFGWIAAVGLATGLSSFDVLGFGAVSDAMRSDLLAQHPRVADTSLSMGLTVQGEPLKTFDFSGLDVTAGLLAGRFALLLLALGLALSAALWFARFDPSREGSAIKGTASGSTIGSAAGLEAGASSAVSDVAPVVSPPVAPPVFAGSELPIAQAARGNSFGELVAGELRILLRGVPVWWWIGALGLILAGLLVPQRLVAFPILPLAWVWPVLIWSRLGAQQREHDVHLLVDSGPDRHRRLVAEWLSGLLLTAFAGLGPLVRMGVAADGAGVAAWFGGLVFIPSLALALGVLGRSNRLFQAVYLMLWYAVVNSTAPLDFMGALRENGHSPGPGPLVVLVVGATLLAVALMTKEVRHARR